MRHTTPHAPDLFSYDEAYPAAPGFKKDGTSAEAAERIAPSAHSLRGRVFALFRQGHELSADQAAKMLGKSVLSVRPRVSELVATNLIEPTGRRCRNESGMSADIMRLKQVA